jgi:hypothetical protein
VEAVDNAALSRIPKTRSSLSIADCRLTIEKVVWQLLPMSIGNRQSKIGNSSHPGTSDDRRKLAAREENDLAQGS